ncbi:MAG: tRNA (guanine(6)-N2)-methyltransferase [Nitrososphaerota archaeon]
MVSLGLEFFATTIYGLEDVAAAEVRELTGRDALSDIAKVIFRGDVMDAALLNYASRCCNRIFVMLARREVESLAEIERTAREVDYSEIIDENQSFAVRSERHGSHPFTSMDMSAAVGRGVIESYKGSRGVRLRVDLDNPDVELFALLRDSEFILGLNTTGRSLHNRYYRVFHHRAGLSATIAASMLRLSGWRSSESLLDPFCGSGTIPIEAGLMGLKIAPGLMASDMAMYRLRIFSEDLLRSVREKLVSSEERWRELKILGSDASPRYIDGALMNARAAGLEGKLRIVQGDVRKIDEWLFMPIDKVVTNPPFGVRMGLRRAEEFYTSAFKALSKAAPGALVTFLTNKPVIVGRSMNNAGWSLIDKRRIIYGTLEVSIIMAKT